MTAQEAFAEQQERQQLIEEIRGLLRSPETQRGYHLLLAGKRKK